MSKSVLAVIAIQNDIPEHYRDIMDRINTTINRAAESNMVVYPMPVI